ncbi:MAG: acylneuraminate cytidylyltransferase family protein [bacterium]|nr:acylneuraminate cytidylyltransferase family protein [bacterium]MDZ4299600.1 acylneuraminate cytidylyltransferase family protein [Candidatus Sungbacteria bacterium]
MTTSPKHHLNILGVVGARAGSKSIPDKNIRPLLGRPLMAWIIDAAKHSRHITRLILSTDSPRYAEIGRTCGAETPFLRPAECASDTASDIDYLSHAVAWLEKNEGWKADIILRLPPTSPLCTTKSIDACIEYLLNDPETTASRTITAASKHPYKLWRVEGETLHPFMPREMTGHAEPSNMPRQSYTPTAYTHVDAIAVRYDTLMRDHLLTGPKVRYHLIDKSETIDIDTETDFLVAELLLKKRFNDKGAR